MIAVEGSWLLVETARAALARVAEDSWTLSTGDFWCRADPPDRRPREQGWRLHVSATQLAAPLVLACSAASWPGGAARSNSPGGLDELGTLLSSQCERGSGGKFITAYPDDDEQLCSVAEELHRATDGLPGPVILNLLSLSFLR